MQTVIIVIHLMVVLALVGVVLLQRSEGGGLGIGGGSGFMTARGAANALTRTTGILALVFFTTSLALSILARYGDRPIDILDRPPGQTEEAPGNNGGAGVLDQLGGSNTRATPPASSPADTAPAPAETSPPPAGAATPAPAGTATPPASGESTAPATPAQPQVPTDQ